MKIRNVLSIVVLLVAAFLLSTGEARATSDGPCCTKTVTYKVVTGKSIKDLNRKLRANNAKGFHIYKNLNPDGYKMKLRKVRVVCK